MNITHLSVEAGLIVIGIFILAHIKLIKRKLRKFILRQAQNEE